jgi:hypothetical protein
MPTLPNGFTQQGNSTLRQQQGGSSSGTPQEPFSGGFRVGFLPLDTNIRPDTTAISTSPTSFAGSGSNFSFPQPGFPQPSGFAQQGPPIAPRPPPDINWDEYAGVLHQIILNANLVLHEDAIAGS